MRIRLKYGDYEHELEEAAVAIDRRSNLSDTGAPFSIITRWDIEGTLISDTQANLSTAIDDLIAAYASHGQDAQLLFDDDSPTSHVLLSANTWGGVRVVRPPSFPQGRDGEYTVYRNFAVTLEAEERIDGNEEIVSWKETVEIRGTGGPRRAVIEVIAGYPQEQITTTNSMVTATQRGQAVGLTSWPTPPGPLWPDAEQVAERVVTRDHPQAIGSGANRVYREFPRTWSYSFISAIPLINGLPSQRPGY